MILFTYNRPEHTRRTIEALAANELAGETELFVFSDAAKKEADAAKVREIRDYVGELARACGGPQGVQDKAARGRDGEAHGRDPGAVGTAEAPASGGPQSVQDKAARGQGGVRARSFCAVTLTARQENYGLARNVIEGVTELIARYGRVIVLEDDLVTDRYFLRFVNDGLDRYADEKRVTGITGFSHFRDDAGYPHESYFNTLTGTSWSWATWADRWDHFDAECADWTEMISDKGLRRAFNYDNSYDFYKIMKQQQTDEGTNSWAIRWYWTNFKRDGLILSPAKSLVSNEGWDGSGVHCGKAGKPVFCHGLGAKGPITDFPEEIRETEEAHRLMRRMLKREWEPSAVKRAYHLLARKNYVGQA